MRAEEGRQSDSGVIKWAIDLGVVSSYGRTVALRWTVAVRWPETVWHGAHGCRSSCARQQEGHRLTGAEIPQECG